MSAPSDLPAKVLVMESGSGSCAAPEACCGPAKGSSGRFEDADERLAAVFRALAHPARLAILRQLADHPASCCGDVVKASPFAQSTVSQHLQALKEAGLVTCVIKGRCCHYSVDPDGLRLADGLARSFFDVLTPSADPALQG